MARVLKVEIPRPVQNVTEKAESEKSSAQSLEDAKL